MKWLKWILGLGLVLAPVVAVSQSTSFWTDRAVGVFPGTNHVTFLVPIQNGQVRVCTAVDIGGAFSPCPDVASIFDTSGNPLSVVGGNFGQIKTDVVGRYSFGCASGVSYLVQVAAGSSNTPQLSYPITCPPNFSLTNLLPTNNTWVGANIFTGTVSAKTFESVQYADQYQLGSTTCGVMEAIAASSPGGVVWLPLNSCTITTGISYSKLISLRGHCTVMTNDNTYGGTTPPTGCSELVNGTTGATAITVNLPGTNFGSGWEMRDFSIKGNRFVGGATAGDGIKFVGGAGTTVMRDILVQNVMVREAFGAGFHVSNNAFIVHFNNVRAVRSGSDGFLVDQSTGTPSQIRIVQSDFDLNNACGVHVGSSATIGDIDVSFTTMADSATASGLCVDNGSGATTVSIGNHYEANNQDGEHLFGSSQHTSYGDVFNANGVNDYNLSCAGQGFATPFLRAYAPTFFGTTPTNWRIAANCNRSGLYNPSPSNPVIVDAGSFTTDYILNVAYNFSLGQLNISGTPAAGGGTACLRLLDTTSAQTTPNKQICSRLGQFQLFNSANAAIIFAISDIGNIILASGNVLISATAPSIAAAGCGGAAASIPNNNGTAAFEVNVGTTPGSACTITMPTAAHGWACDATDVTTNSTSVFLQKESPAASQTTTQIVITNFNDVAAATAFTASDVMRVKCSGY